MSKSAKHGKHPAKPTPLLRQWQPSVTRSVHATDGSGAYSAASTVRMADFDPAAQPYAIGSKLENKAAVKALAEEIDLLQDVLLADRRHALLVILQGMDASGKDGTLRGVFSHTSPLGVRSVGWKAPTSLELSHDYLWRLHAEMPARGEIVVFNRSQYEDVLVPVVNRSISTEQTRQRYAQINDFERMLSENGTVILKFMLHISKDEQRERLQERVDDPTRHWKFEVGDLEVRRHWDDYQQAYAQLLSHTSTPWAPWTVVPADSKTHRNLMIATVVRDTLQGMDLRYPPPKPELKGVTIK